MTKPQHPITFARHKAIKTQKNKDMKKNVGNIDKVVRIVLGLAIGGLGIAYQSWWGLIGLLPIATALVGSCGVYTLLGISTCKKES